MSKGQAESEAKDKAVTVGLGTMEGKKLSRLLGSINGLVRY